ncbi:ribonuclease H-like protein [Coprinellus micaceus]|uniref:ribonuclease H n=1 Tax=Coprinellus micaceus TaxID=71717 RepID=A0A4Y7SV35_COPMI|nr:ribonuclease H-like protein [Coprinellus micaceus]
MDVYVDGACLNNGRKNARAGSGAYWGPGCARNVSVRVPVQTNNRAEVFAVLCVLRNESPQKPLHVYSDSEYVMESLITRGPQNAARGWDVTNGDLLRDAASLLRRRPAPVTFIQVKGHIGLKPHDMADSLAKDGALLPDALIMHPLPTQSCLCSFRSRASA